MTHQHHRYHQAKKVTLVGGGVNIFLGISKILGGFFFYSHALIADGLHSFADLFIDMMVLFASKYGNQDADEAHPYGHQRIETAATLLLALLLILTGLGIAWDSFQHILSHTITIPNYLAVPIAVVSVIVNELLFYLTRRVGQRIQSSLIIANAWHHRSDAAASAIVLVGIIGSLFGYTFLDPLAATIVGGLIIKMGMDYAWDSVQELVDTGVSPKEVEELRRMIAGVEGVNKVHQLRNRKMGGDIFVDVHVLVSPCISVSEGHYIAQKVHYSLMQANRQIKDVTVHVDPEDDELVSPSKHLPTRLDLEKKYLQAWQAAFPEIESFILHYLDGRISIEIKLQHVCQRWAELEEMIQHDLNHSSLLGTIEVVYRHSILTPTSKAG